MDLKRNGKRKSNRPKRNADGFAGSFGGDNEDPDAIMDDGILIK
jgi:hypothetical protein